MDSSDEETKPSKKKQKRIVQCGFSDLMQDSTAHIDFLMQNLGRTNVKDDVVLQYALIHALIRLGENLTFIRDDSELSYKAMYDQWRANLKRKRPESVEVQLIVDFIYLRNQLLHHNVYRSSSTKTNDLISIFDQAFRGLFIKGKAGQRGPRLEELRQFFSKISPPITGSILSKEVGAAPEFTRGIPDCISALVAELGTLSTITSSSSAALHKDHALESCYLRCCQIISDLQKVKGIENLLTDEICVEFSEVLSNTTILRERLGHVLSFGEQERAQIKSLFEKINHKTLSEFVKAVQAAKLAMDEKKSLASAEILLPGPDELLGEGSSLTATSPFLHDMPVSDEGINRQQFTSQALETSPPHALTFQYSSAKGQSKPSYTIEEDEARPSLIPDYPDTDDEDITNVDKQAEEEDTERGHSPK